MYVFWAKKLSYLTNHYIGVSILSLYSVALCLYLDKELLYNYMYSPTLHWLILMSFLLQTLPLKMKSLLNQAWVKPVLAAP